MPDSGEKTEQATPKKRDDERKKGNIFVSKDINTLVSVIASFYIFSFFVSSLLEQTQNTFRLQFDRITSLDVVMNEEVMRIYVDILVVIATTILPAMILAGLASVCITLLQSRFLISYESMKFKLERISLLKGFKRLFSLRSLVELAKSLVKIIILTWILYTNIVKVIQILPNMVDWDIMQALQYAGDKIMSLLLSVAIAYAAIAGLDFLYQRYEYEKGIRMTKQEIKDEYKNMEGNPEVKSKRRQKQQEMAQRRMMQNVKDADVIVRNPTHFAVALKYTIDQDPAPIVLAKGADLIAQKIVAEGEKHNIATVENKALARGLYEAADVYGFIPEEFFQPVAELLAWLYSTKEKPQGLPAHPQPPPPTQNPQAPQEFE